jgi:hypothetical protein
MQIQQAENAEYRTTMAGRIAVRDGILFQKNGGAPADSTISCSITINEGQSCPHGN